MNRRLRLLFYGSVLVVALHTQAFAAAAPSFCPTVNRGLVQFLPASTPGNYSTLYTAAANGSRCNAFWVDNNDSANTHIITCQLVNATVKYGGYSLTTATSAGTTSFVLASLMPATTIVGQDSDTNPVIEMISGDSMQCTYATAVNTAQQVDIHIQCCDE